MTGTGKWKASLVSSQRGCLVSRWVGSRGEAIAMAQRLLDDAVDQVQMHGERISAAVEEAVG
jgi:hypothetical protein